MTTPTLEDLTRIRNALDKASVPGDRKLRLPAVFIMPRSLFPHNGDGYNVYYNGDYYQGGFATLEEAEACAERLKAQPFAVAELGESDG